MAKSFLKKDTKETPIARNEELLTAKPIFDEKHKVVYVNPGKYKRAEVILGLISGKITPRRDEEIERKAHYSGKLQEHGIDIASEEALPALYELLGGLIRTPQEQIVAEKQAEEIRKKGKKKMIE